MDSKLQTLINEYMPRRYYGHEARKYAKIIAEEYAASKIQEAQGKCTIPVVSGSLPLASADKIMERIVPKYRDANPHDRAVIAGICDEVLDQSGAFLGEVRTRAMAKQ